jgi:hypothetical protein
MESTSANQQMGTIDNQCNETCTGLSTTKMPSTFNSLSENGETLSVNDDSIDL